MEVSLESLSDKLTNRLFINCIWFQAIGQEGYLLAFGLKNSPLRKVGKKRENRFSSPLQRGAKRRGIACPGRFGVRRHTQRQPELLRA